MPEIFSRESRPFAFGERGAIATPFQFYTSGAENLRIVSVNALAGVTIVVALRMLTEAPEPQWIRFTHTPNSDRTVKQTDHALGRGFILNAITYAEGATPRIGQTFVQIEVIGGLGGATMALGTLLQGYVTSTQKLAWPGSPIQSSIDGGGVIRVVTGTAPAAGAETSETVPTGARWQLLAWSASLTTSAAAGTRRPAIEFDDGATDILRSNSVLTLNASQGGQFRWTIGAWLETLIGAGGMGGGIPGETPLLAGHRIRTATVAMAAGDQWSAPLLLVREWLEAQ